MAVPSTPLIVNISDPDKTGMLYSFDARNLISSPLFVRNDGNPIALRLCVPSVSGVRVFDDFDPTGYTVSLAIGEPDAVPTSGTWQLSSGAYTTSVLAATASAATVQTALNALSGVAVSVASTAAGLYVVTYTALGAQTLLTVATNNLNPVSGVVVSRIVTGSASAYEVQIVRITLASYALNEDWTPFAAADVDIDTLVAGGVSTYQVDVITLDPRPYAGTFTIGASSPIAYNATATAVQAAIPSSVVTGNAGGPWTVTSTVYGAISRTGSASGLTAPIGLDGTLALNTYGMLQRFLGTTDSVITLTMELQLRLGSDLPVTVLQVPVRVSRDVIDTDVIIPGPGSAPIGAILFTEASAANSTGNTTITVPVGSVIHSEKLTFTGSAGTRIIVLATTNAQAAGIMRLDYVLPATAGIVIEVRNGTTGGTLLDTLTTDTSGDPASFEATFRGGAWGSPRAMWPSA